MTEVTLILAFTAGIVSFLAPCVLPIIPGFLAYISGGTVQNANARRRDIFLASVFFVLGFSIVFAVLGTLFNSILEAAAYTVQQWFARVGGAFIIFFGLYLTGLISLPFLERQHTVNLKRKFSSRPLTALAFGATFAAGWTPCVGPALGAIFGLAAVQPGSAFPLLLAFSFGLGVPFLLVGAFTAQAANLINRYASRLVYLNRIFGVIIILAGVLVFTQSLSWFASFDFVNRWILK